MSGTTVERVPTDDKSVYEKTALFELGEKSQVSSPAPAKWKAKAHHDYAALEALWRKMEKEGNCTVFQTYDWASCWYETAQASGEAEPLVVTVYKDENEPAWLLPLCIYNKGKLKIVSFADLGISDYTAPVIGRNAPSDRKNVRAMFEAAQDVLPPCDAIHFQKLGNKVEAGISNPLLMLKGVERFIADCHGIRLSEPWRELADKIMQPRLRSTIRRKKKKLEQQGEIVIERYDSPEEIDGPLERLMVMRHERYESIGRPDFAPAWREFYRKLATREDRSLHVSVATLKISGEEIATCFGVTRGNNYHALLPTFKIGKWEPYRPGMLLFDALLTDLSQKALAENTEGFFDFTVGDEIYKKRFGSESSPLFEWVEPRSMKGFAYFMVWRTKVLIRRYPNLANAIKNIIGRGQAFKEGLVKQSDKQPA